MPPTVLEGGLATAGTGAVLSDQLEVDFLGRVYGYDPPGSPLLHIITKRAQVMGAEAVQVDHLEDDVISEWGQADGAYTNVATTINVQAGTGVQYGAGMYVKNVATGEVFRVDSVATDALTVTRAQFGTTGTAGSDLDWHVTLGRHQEEGATAPAARATQKVKKTNLCQILKEPIHITNTAQAVEHRVVGDEFAYQRRKAGEAHARNWEQVIIHGVQGSETGGGGRLIRSAGGLVPFITTNVLDATASFTETIFNNFIGDVMRHNVAPGSRRKLLLASRSLINAINGFGTDKIRLNQKATGEYGVDISTYVTGLGTVDLLYHPLMENGYEGQGLLVDLPGIWRRPLRDTKLQTNIQGTDEDGMKEQFITEQSFSYNLEKCHGRLFI